MITFETRAQYLSACTDRTANSHRPPVGPYLWRCDECGKVSPNSDGYGANEHAMYCYACCRARDIKEMADRSKPFACYLSDDGKTVINWPGGILGRVTWSSVSRTGWHGSTLTHINVTDVHGGRWYGKGSGRGMFILLRACKS
jgi:hypothetical protein